MNRRSFLGTAGALSVGALFRGAAAFAQDATPFSRSDVVDAARALAAKPFEQPGPAVPDALLQLSYSDYQKIRFKEERRLFTNPPSGFAVDLLHPGFIYRIPVEIYTVENGKATKIPFSTDLFTYQGIDPPAEDTPLEFSGFRGRTPLNSPDYMDEFLVFAGASYFRAIARGQVFGLSARGLSIGTADPAGEEFPFFRTFWLERPGDGRMVVHALLDGPSASGAFRFTIRPGDETVMDVEATIFARVDIKTLGLAPLTSMFLYDAKERDGYDDFRPGIHDSDGLAMWNGGGERIWRPLHNPRLLQISSFSDNGPRGFGLIQREKRFSEYEDLEALYHKRPSLWVEPIGDWGKGHVMLVEIPNVVEIHDNMVAFWRPEQPLSAGSETSFTYRLTWGWDAPATSLLRVTRTLSGQGEQEGRRRFVVDFSTPGVSVGAPATDFTANISASAGAVRNVVVMDNPEIGGIRVAFELDPQGNEAVDLRLDLLRQGAPGGEVWVYRWTE
ncbi:glucan biosynthesis protein [Amaricoccus solimangrovi]|uniref:Glucan biosynthesis protein G n=1 Tax=Amaricoccus solimangrovi TaxID=2589815 RepID=A0A501WY02_9RHOB|nr:glucan biosynthesis protein G [Amaricoccus solimangrovi]TPE50786.1 glucan biosynthesis protein G [Amaricoccus solimangrovi]